MPDYNRYSDSGFLCIADSKPQEFRIPQAKLSRILDQKQTFSGFQKLDSLKVMLQRNTALQHCWDIESNGCNVVPSLQRWCCAQNRPCELSRVISPLHGAMITRKN